MTSVCPSIRSPVCQSLFQYFWWWSNSGISDELEDLGFVDILSIDYKESIGCNVVSAGRNMDDTWQFGTRNPCVWVFPNSWCMISKPHQNKNIVYLDFSHKSIIWSGWTWRSITTFLCFPLSTFFWKCPSTFTFRKCLSPLSLPQVQSSYKISQAGQYHLDLPFSTESIRLRPQGLDQS